MRREFPERPVVSVGAVILRGDQVLLVKRAVQPSAGLWSIPGGAIELGETPEEALLREVIEETGLQVEPVLLVDVYNYIFEDHERIRFHYVVIDYLCRHVVGKPKAGSDVAEARWVEVSDIDKYRTTSMAPQAIRKALEMRRYGESD